METLFEIFSTLTTQNEDTSNLNFFSLSSSFANQTGWSPSYFIKADSESFANAHLAVEHGLENTAILTFLNKPYDFLTFDERKTLINISYNNLVDWHIPIDQRRITFLYNRADLSKTIVDAQSIDTENYSNLRIEAFEKIIGRKPSPNTPALDVSLSETISKWKRRINIELWGKINNEDISSLFNSIILIRAIEDNFRKYRKKNSEKVLLNEFKKAGNSNLSFKNICISSLKALEVSDIPMYLIDTERLSVFDLLNKQDLYNLFQDFYTNNVNSFFDYDFSIISHHALSRIYEKYVSILKTEDTIQGNLFGVNSPVEKINKSSGTYYTPQYIARFFAKLVQKEFSVSRLSKIKVLEPAVGSGIFLRSLLELQIDSLLHSEKPEAFDAIFRNITGIDIDENACHASKLSLSLLYLIFTNKFPDSLNIINADSIIELSKDEYSDAFEVIISNPPFIRGENRGIPGRERIIKHLGDKAQGKVDEYLLFIDKALNALKPDGICLFVLPHSFLINDSGLALRKIIHEKAIIKYLVDLSAITVFENTGIYVSLLVFRKRNTFLDDEDAVVLKCRSSVGKALADVLKGNYIDNLSYSIYQIDQSYFKNDQWFVLGKEEISIKNKLESFPRISKFLEIKQGFITGRDDVFIVNKPPNGEEKIYNIYIPDKEIEQYNYNKDKIKYVFFPYFNGVKLDQDTLEKKFPKTWAYLLKNKQQLTANKLPGGNWWKPSRPKDPKDILNAKIITPHLVFSPRFSIDLSGKITTSHSPYLFLKEDIDSELLFYFLGILNSTPCFWYISTHSHKYGGNYNRLEVGTLKNCPVPDPTLINATNLLKYIKLVKQRVAEVGFSKELLELENEIDKLSCEFYRLTADEIKLFHGNFSSR